MSQEAESLFARANSAFVDENYEEALTLYNSAITSNPTKADYFLKRSFCNYKLRKYTAALDDTNSALKLEPNNALAYLRKGMAAFALDEFESAKSAFIAGQSLDPTNTTFKTWIRKCTVEMEEESEPIESITEPKTLHASKTESHVQPKIPDDLPDLEPDKDDQVSTKPEKVDQVSTKPETSVATQPPAPSKLRHDWYQNEAFVMLSVFAKGCKKEDVQVYFSEKKINVFIQSNEGKFEINLDLCDKIVPSECKYEVLSAKIEIKLKKLRSGRWNDLEDTGKGVASWSAVQDKKPTYGSKNWDKIAKELVSDDKLEGDAALNKVFQDIYQNASDDQRRAMQKSFLESGGTVLSTNWDEVGKAPVKGSPPQGLEMRNWNEDK
eukprot:TRINITY_DN6285_c0_g2_i1.p1 TRINITY_DN6285_c0_g2~~TRINITY_DN6285_c0_g2_i1.p1  ORF type:complete len:381 (+),score=93.46 TRINITY_DN6285_c0_g2_i1:67-1209(+)